MRYLLKNKHFKDGEYGFSNTGETIIETTMQQSNIDKLEKYRFVLAGRSFTPSPGFDLNEVLQVIHEEFDPNYHVDMFCSYCKMKMMEYAFQKLNEYHDQK